MKAPTLLLIDTATDAFSVAVAQGETLLADYAAEQPRAHAEMITWAIGRVLDQAGLKPTDLSAVAVGLGPGSYTGLRIGLAAAKGMCFALSIPLIGCGSLRGLAEIGRVAAGVKAQPGMQFIPMIDARRMEVYAATYALSADGLDEIRPPHAWILTTESLAATPAPAALVGTGAAKARGLLHAVADIQVLDQVVSHARGLLPEALSRWSRGDVATLGPMLDGLEPFYLKPVAVGGAGTFDTSAPDPR